MGRGTGWAQAVADGINGYIRGTQIKQGMDDAEEERGFRREQRDNMRSDRANADDLQRQLRADAAPVEVAQGAGGLTLPANMDNRDVGQPGEPGLAAGGLMPGQRVGNQSYANTVDATAAAATASSPDAVAARQVQTMRRAGKPGEAQQLETAGLQGKNAKLELDEKQQKFIDTQFDKKLSTVRTPDDLARVLSGTPAVGGGKVTVLGSPDGKKFQLGVEMNGEVKPWGPEVDNNAKAIARVIAEQSQSMTAQQKIGLMQHWETFDETVRHNKVGEEHQGATLAESKRHNIRAEGLSAGHLSVAQEGLKLTKDKFDADLKNDPMHNLPGAVKIRATGLEKQITNLENTINKAAAEPGYDPNSPGISDLRVRAARLNGERNELLKPYLGEGVGGKGDYMGYSGAPSAKAPQTDTGRQSAAGPSGSIQFRQPGSQAATQGVTGPTSQPAPGAVPAAGGPAADPLVVALGGGSGNASLDAIVAQKVPAFQQAAEVLRVAQSQVAQAAQSGNQGAVAQAMQAASTAGAQLEGLLRDMMPAQQQRVKQALGVL